LERQPRSDVWTDAQDQLLVATILRHVREGSTQVAAFKEVGNAIQRTAEACGFRWNTVLRKQNTKAFEKAKKQRLIMRNGLDDGNGEMIDVFIAPAIHESDVEASQTEEKVTLDSVISNLDNIIGDVRILFREKEDDSELKAENERLKAENQELKEKLDEVTEVIEALNKIGGFGKREGV
jgi:prespore-specific regulator